VILVSVVLVIWTRTHRQSGNHALALSHTSAGAVQLVSELGNHHHPISTSSAEAQRFFNQGLTYHYAFNDDEAARSFVRAAELDPQSAMAAWGVALALGPGYHGEVVQARAKSDASHEAVRKALELARQVPDWERAYVEALAKRVAGDADHDQPQAAAYKNAMRQVMQQYPDDLDAATLFAESALRLHNWQIWDLDGKANEDAEEIVTTLESVLRRAPLHIGANHYYVHALEGSPHPERALASAERLQTLAPAAGHLLHMPSHIYIQIGEYDKAAQQNEIAVAADEAYLQESGALGHYLLHYYSHNLTFLAVARAMQGRFGDAWTASQKLAAFLGPHVHEIPMLESAMQTPLITLVRFRRWQEILRHPPPEERVPMVRAFWHFARSMAFAETGNPAAAEKEQKMFLARILAGGTSATRLSPFPAAAAKLLEARIASARNNRKEAIELLKAAVKEEENIVYHDPPLFYLHVRESLGGALMLAGNYAEAESVFREDLRKYPRNGRSLFGLLESLKAQGKHYAAQLVQSRFDAAWQRADTPLKLEDL
jgi:tetratricopeptide (TPR) repeat protein